MKIACDGWVYEVPPEAEFIEVTSREGERAFVQCFDGLGEKMPPMRGEMLESVAPVAPWPKRLLAR